MNRHLVGLLLGTEEDWPAAFEVLMRRMGTVRDGGGTEHAFDVERITIEPFDLRDRPRYDLVRFTEIPGGHGWDNWSAALPDALRWFAPGP